MDDAQIIESFFRRDPAALDAVQQKYAAKGKTLTVIGLDGASRERLDKLSGRLGAGH